jgi:hypothetical protein
LIRESILKIRVPELIDRTRLSHDLPFHGTLQQGHKPHPLPLQTKTNLAKEQEWRGTSSEPADEP